MCYNRLSLKSRLTALEQRPIENPPGSGEGDFHAPVIVVRLVGLKHTFDSDTVPSSNG